jgi:hypothetical protein
MFPVRLGSRELGLKLVLLGENRSHQKKRPPLEEEKRDDRVGDPFNISLKESLTQQRNEMMDNFTHILQQLSMAVKTSSRSSHFEGTTYFKVQVNFDIPLFEGYIDANSLEK